MLRADDSLVHARRAQAALGPDVWSRVIRIENQARGSRYPRVLHALVFELASVLWFYADTDGTQSFSLHRGRLAEEKADFGPLLRDIDPGFTRWSVAPEGVATAGEIPNGCFIESVAALRGRLARGEEVANPELLAVYCDTPTGRKGHTVLAYSTHENVEVVDSEPPAMRRSFSRALADDALALGRAMFGNDVVRARAVSLQEFVVRAAVVAATERGRGGEPTSLTIW